MIVDGHTHAWARWPYPPADPEAASRGRYQNLMAELDAAGVGAAVLVSANLDSPVGAGNAGNNEYAAGAVAACPGRLYQFADVDSRWSQTYHRAGAAARLADACDRLAPAGVSHYLGPDNDGWLRSAEGREFLAAADDRRVAVSLAAPPAWFDDVRLAAASVPATPVMLNHLALVMLHSGGRPAALEMIKRGAGQPNLVAKVSGYYYGADRPWEFPFPAQLEIVRALYENWGPSRMAWASDYPACTPHITYRQSLDVIREHADFIDEADLGLILGGTMTAILTRTWRPPARLALAWFPPSRGSRPRVVRAPAWFAPPRGSRLRVVLAPVGPRPRVALAPDCNRGPRSARAPVNVWCLRALTHRSTIIVWCWGRYATRTPHDHVIRSGRCGPRGM